MDNSTIKECPNNFDSKADLYVDLYKSIAAGTELHIRIQNFYCCNVKWKILTYDLLMPDCNKNMEAVGRVSLALHRFV